MRNVERRIENGNCSVAQTAKCAGGGVSLQGKRPGKKPVPRALSECSWSGLMPPKGLGDKCRRVEAVWPAPKDLDGASSRQPGGPTGFAASWIGIG